MTVAISKPRQTLLIVLLVVALYLTWHLAVLRLPFIPSYDEMTLASITHSMAVHGTLQFDSAPWAFQGQLGHIYGPVFFWVTAPLFRVFGAHVIWLRLTTFVCGVGLIALVWRLSRRYLPDHVLVGLVALTFAMDPILDISMHIGRMDTMAVLLIVCAFALFETSRTRHGVAIGLLAVAAILVTPRAALVLVPLFVLSAVRLFSAESRARSLSTFLVVAAAYLSWTIWAFGGPLGAVAFYRQFPREVTGHIVIPWYQIAVIAAVVALQARHVMTRGVAGRGDLRFVAVGAIVLFYSVVHEFWGGYSIYLLPFYYLLLAHGLSAVPRRVGMALVAAILAVNTTVVAVHGSRTLRVQRTEASWNRAEAAIGETIPSGSRVIADGRYLISLMRQGSEVESLTYELVNDDDRERYNREVFDYQYLLVGGRFMAERPTLLPMYRAHAALVEARVFEDPDYGFVVYRRLEQKR